MQIMHVQLLLFARPVPTHSINSTKKKWLLCAGFERAKGWCMLSKWHVFSQIAPPPPNKKQVCPTTTNQKNKFALAINACWQNFFYDMCVTPANIVEEHLQHLAGSSNS
jgi:hypothetical protein